MVLEHSISAICCSNKIYTNHGWFFPMLVCLKPVNNNCLKTITFFIRIIQNKRQTIYKNLIFWFNLHCKKYHFWSHNRKKKSSKHCKLREKQRDILKLTRLYKFLNRQHSRKTHLKVYYVHNAEWIIQIKELLNIQNYICIIWIQSQQQPSFLRLLKASPRTSLATCLRKSKGILIRTPTVIQGRI